MLTSNCWALRVPELWVPEGAAPGTQGLDWKLRSGPSSAVKWGAAVGFPDGSDCKESPEMQKTRVWSLGQEEPLEESMATHSSILAWRIPWTEEPGRLLSMGSQRVRHDWVTNTFTFKVGLLEKGIEPPKFYVPVCSSFVLLCFVMLETESF